MDDSKRSEIYQKTREDILKRQLSNNENFDRAILTLSSAGLALSVTFLKGSDHQVHFWILIASWICFVLAIVVTIISYQTSQRGLMKLLSQSERYHLHGDESVLKERNRFAEWTERCAVISAIAFVLAIVLLLIYFALNLRTSTEQIKMAKENKIVDRGSSIPPLQRITEGASVPPLSHIHGGASVPSLQIIGPKSTNSPTSPSTLPSPPKSNGGSSQ